MKLHREGIYPAARTSFPHNRLTLWREICYNIRMTYGEKAKENFLNGYTCAQAVLAAFKDEAWFKESGISLDTAMRLASSFGGGMGRLREVCGAVSGMFMALGIARGFTAPQTGEEKTEHYKAVQELAARFTAENGSIICRELLGLTKKDQATPKTETSKDPSSTESVVTGDPYAPKPEARTAEYYKKRPCPDICACAAEILACFLKEEKEKDLQDRETK